MSLSLPKTTTPTLSGSKLRAMPFRPELQDEMVNLNIGKHKTDKTLGNFRGEYFADKSIFFHGPYTRL